MYKIVINSCYGGYKLSIEAVNYIIKRMKELGQEIPDYLNWKSDFYNIYRKNLMSEKEIERELCCYASEKLPRYHPLLIEAVETLGSEKASGMYSELVIVTGKYPSFEIEEFDGNETAYNIDLDHKYIVIPEEFEVKE